MICPFEYRYFRRLFSAFVLSVCAVAGVLPVHAEQSVRPGINRAYQNPDFRLWQARFERPGREVFDKRRQIVDALGLRPGSRVADLGAGTGLFTRLFSARLGPTGKVYAIDISKNFIDAIVRDGRRRGLRNLVGIVNSATDTGLAPGTVDLVFTSNTYHHFEYPVSMLRSIHRSLRPRGRLVIIDFRRQKGVSSDWVMRHVRADRQTVINEVSAQGFRLLEEKPGLRDNYFLVFEKR